MKVQTIEDRNCLKNARFWDRLRKTRRLLDG
jgi:hypothetical protein